MKKLEQAVQELESKNPKRVLTIQERAEFDLRTKLAAISLEKSKAEQELKFKKQHWERTEQNLLIAQLILLGRKGFFRCQQGQFGINSGFTAFEEVVNHIGEMFVDVSVEPMKCDFGMEVWSIAENGMMTIHSRKVDSND